MFTPRYFPRAYFAGAFFPALLAGAGGAGLSLRVELHLAGVWTDVTADVRAIDVDGEYGIVGNGPKDRLADVGTLMFSLNNDPTNSAGVGGYYSPLHAACRPGFQDGITVRVNFAWAGTDWPRFYGKVAHIDPVPGVHASRLTRVVAYDLMNDLIEADLRNVTVQIGQTEAQLMTVLFAALPAAAQPVSLDLDAGLDVSPFAFDTLGEGEKAVTPLADLLLSSLGYGHYGPDGVWHYENRQARQLVLSTFTLDNTMVDLVVPTSNEHVFDRVRATYHPKFIDPAATTVLWKLTGDAPAIAAGETIVIWGDYYKTAEPSVHIGGTAQIAPVVTTDYMANSLANGSGTNKSAALVVVAEPWGSTVKFTITNTDAATVYLVNGAGVPTLQIRGKGLYDLSPVTVESGTGAAALNVDLRYQTNFNITQDLADYLLAQYQALGTQPESVEFVANRSDAHMAAALGAQIGDRITLLEAQTGLIADSFIQRIHWTASPGAAGAGPTLKVRFGLASATFFDDVWVMDDVVLSVIDTSTFLGYA